MDTYEAWEKALKNTEILRSRVKALMAHAETRVPYIFLSEHNFSDTFVRRGEVVVEKPSIILPPNIPQFEGFEFGPEDSQKDVTNFLYIRGITIPSLKYNNKTFSNFSYEGNLGKAIEYFSNQLQHKEDVHTGLLTGPEDCWQFSILIFICSQIARGAQDDIKKLLDDYKKKEQ